MAFKLFAGVLAVVAIIGFLAPYLLKMKDLPLGLVVVAGVAMMLVDLWESFGSED